jgi:hypothetical protein
MKNIPFTENEIKEIKDHYSQELEKIQKRANEIRGIIEKMEGSKVASSVMPEPTVEKIIDKGKRKYSRKTEKKEASLISVNEPVKLPEVVAAKQKGRKKSSITEVPVPQQVAAKTKGVSNKKADVTSETKTKSTKIAKKSAITKVPISKVSKKALKSANAEIKIAKTAKIVPVVSVAEKGRKKSTDSKKSQYESFILGIITKQGKLLTSKVIFDSVEKEFKVPAADYSKMKATVTVILSKEKANGQLKDMAQPGTKAKLYGISEWFDNNGNLKDSSKLK